jgi:ribosomal protein S18 acetylase RimI-like enzyme
MNLKEPIDQNFTEVMTWFKSEQESSDWSGPSFRFPYTLKTFKADLKLDTLKTYCLIDDKNTIYAFGQYYLRIGKCHLGRLVVNPKSRGMGIVSVLMNTLIEKGESDLNVTKSSLFVLDHNSSAIRAYEKFGFIQTKYPETMPLEKCIYMIK